MRHPGAIETIGCFTLLVVAHTLQRHTVHLCIFAAGNERRHAANGVRTVRMAGLHKQFSVGAHERHCHRYLRAVRQLRGHNSVQLANDTEDVIPAPSVQAAAMRAQFVKYFRHLKCRQNIFNQHRGADGSHRQPQQLLRKHKHIVPQARLQMALQLGNVKVRAALARQQLVRIVKEVQAKIKQAS